MEVIQLVWRYHYMIGFLKSQYLAAFSERKTRFYIATKIPKQNNATTEIAVVKTLSRFSKERGKTITCDHGSEFANRSNIEKQLSCNVHFADPY